MFRYVRWGVRAILALGVVMLLHYTLPQRDIVRITNTYNRITTIGENWMFYASPDVGTGEDTARDIRFIETFRPNEKAMVYRNEDTGWIWPPYFKFDSSNLQAHASNLISNKSDPQWVVVTHYGWRIAWMSVYPNAIGIRPVEGPEVRLVPWLNIVVLTVLALVALMVRRIWLQFRERVLEPRARALRGLWHDFLRRADDVLKVVQAGWARLRELFGAGRS